ncbi:hypothetical protein FRC08_002964 [Ceratobasidium sp. 394]|nr:hypothetical protein FRC08_002964 [Ceratobasidium sp. 394]
MTSSGSQGISYKVEELIPEPRNTFSVPEQRWLTNNYLREFCELDGKKVLTSGDRGKQTRMTAAAEFKERVAREFLNTFGFRDPKNRHNKMWPTELRQKTCWDEKNAQLLGTRLYGWLQKQKPEEEKTSASAARVQAKATPKAEYLSPHYKPDPEELKLEAQSLQIILGLLQDPWSARAADEVTAFREHLPSHVDNILRALSRIGNVELVTYGVWVEKENVINMEVATHRSRHFVLEPASSVIREAFSTYALASIGPHLDIDDAYPASTVVGNPNRDYLPVFPLGDIPDVCLLRQLDIWFNAMWRAAGGKHDVPYAILESDSLGRFYSLTDERRYPPDDAEKVFMSPYKMRAPQIQSWAKYIKDGLAGELPADETFQFIQASPGISNLLVQTQVVTDCLIHYPPESLRYAEFVQKLWIGDRADELPLCPVGQHYQSITVDIHDRLEELLGPNDTHVKDLVVCLQAHDSAVPYQVRI